MSSEFEAVKDNYENDNIKLQNNVIRQYCTVRKGTYLLKLKGKMFKG